MQAELKGTLRCGLDENGKPLSAVLAAGETRLVTCYFTDGGAAVPDQLTVRGQWLG